METEAKLFSSVLPHNESWIFICADANTLFYFILGISENMVMTKQ